MLLALELGAALAPPAVNPDTMTRKPTKIRTLAAVLALALIAAVVVKWLFFPAVTDNDFAVNERSLRQAPPGLVILRPTHYAFLRSKGVQYADPPRPGDHGHWMMGRNLPLRDLLAAAYGQDRARVILPPDAPAGTFDFLVTTATNQEARLQAVIRRKLGWTAQAETRDTEVLALKVLTTPALTVSDPAEKPSADFDNVRFYFRHLPVAVLANGLNQFLTVPVIDQTGLTNFYDYSIPWDAQTQRRMGNDTIARAAADQLLQGWCLGLVPDTASLKMLVAKKVD